jgi:hypothetical protein
MEHIQEMFILTDLAGRRIKEMEARIQELEAEVAAAKPRCLYEGYANARDYLEAVLELPKYWEMEETFCRDKRSYNAMVTVRRPAEEGRLPFFFKELRTSVLPRADGRKIATASLERDFTSPIRRWFNPRETHYLRNCPLYEGDCFLEELRAKHTDEELEDLFYAFQGTEKKTWTEAHAPPSPLQAAETRAAVAEERAVEAEKKLAAAQAKPEIKRQSAMQMVIAISLIARACPEAGFQEIRDLWAAHADADAAEAQREDAANAGGAAGRAALRALMGDWLSAGMPEKKCLCACLEPGCPTFDKVYVRGRGFVDRYTLEEEQEAAKPKVLSDKPDHWGSYCGDCVTPEMCPTCQPMVCGEMEELELPAAAAPPAAPKPAPAPPKPRTWAQVAGAKKV